MPLCPVKSFCVFLLIALLILFFCDYTILILLWPLGCNSQCFIETVVVGSHFHLSSSSHNGPIHSQYEDKCGADDIGN